MIEGLILLVGAGGTGLGVVLGMSIARLRRPVARMPQSYLICPCKHSRGHHLDDGVCQAQQLKYVTNNKQQMVSCGCTKYFGPKMIEEWVPGPQSLPGGE